MARTCQAASLVNGQRISDYAKVKWTNTALPRRLPPKSLRESILRSGLQACSQARGGTPARFAYVCLATSPSSAWVLTNADEQRDEEGWDLWQVQVRDGDPLSIRGDFSPYIREVRVLRSLPADRVWFVGERGLYAHEGLTRIRVRKKRK